MNQHFFAAQAHVPEITRYSAWLISDIAELQKAITNRRHDTTFDTVKAMRFWLVTIGEELEKIEGYMHDYVDDMAEAQRDQVEDDEFRWGEKQ